MADATGATTAIVSTEEETPKPLSKAARRRKARKKAAALAQTENGTTHILGYSRVLGTPPVDVVPQ